MIPNYNFIAISLHGIASCSCLFDCLFLILSRIRELSIVIFHCEILRWEYDNDQWNITGKNTAYSKRKQFYFHACELKLVFNNQRLTRMHLSMEYWYINVCCESANAQHLKCQIMWLFQGKTANYNWIYNWNRDEVQNRFTK